LGRVRSWSKKLPGRAEVLARPPKSAFLTLGMCARVEVGREPLPRKHWSSTACAARVGVHARAAHIGTPLSPKRAPVPPHISRLRWASARGTVHLLRCGAGEKLTPPPRAPSSWKEPATQQRRSTAPLNVARPPTATFRHRQALESVLGEGVRRRGGHGRVRAQRCGASPSHHLAY
jgi:hypothetical protein